MWDSWDPSGNRDRDANIFTAEDLVAVTLLSVQVPAQGAFFLLGENNAELNRLLADVGPDRDLSNEPDPSLRNPRCGGWRRRFERFTRRANHGVQTDRAQASATLPIYDDVIGRELGTKSAHLEPVRVAMREDELQSRLLDLRARAGLDESVPVIRVLDVLAWMQGKGYKPAL